MQVELEYEDGMSKLKIVDMLVEIVPRWDVPAAVLGRRGDWDDEVRVLIVAGGGATCQCRGYAGRRRLD